MTDPLTAVVESDTPEPFALLRRADGTGIDLLLGETIDVDRLGDVPIPPPRTSAHHSTDDRPGHRTDDPPATAPTSLAVPRVLALVPYRQVTERGFACHDDGTPLRCLMVREHAVLTPDDVLAAIPDTPVEVTGHGFDIDDDAYGEIVGAVIRDEIGRGEGANFVIRRDYRARLHGSVPHAALRLFRRLLLGEPNAYWTFVVHAGDVTMVGATPERHVSVADGTVVMNPISGTYRPPREGASGAGLLRFLADAKETEELFMAVDEELKMMSRVCHEGGQVVGPFLKEMGHLVHTEYLLQGRSRMDVRDVLRETMFAPTVTGSPVENAARIITRYEQNGRGYYAGVAALIGHDAGGRQVLDAPILIRTAYIDPDGTVRVPVGATLVRHSISGHEVHETHVKAAGVLTALGLHAKPVEPATDDGRAAAPLLEYPGVGEALTLRNATLAPFWLHDHSDGGSATLHGSASFDEPQPPDGRPPLDGRSAVVIDVEDGWTAMFAHLLRRLGMVAEVRRWSEVGDTVRHDLMVAGPGPGDPRDTSDPRIRRMRYLVTRRLADQRPLLAVCLSHQMLADILGFPVVPLAQPYQGTQREIDLFGRRTRVGFYNTYTARTMLDSRAPVDVPTSADVPAGLRIAADADTGDVHALRGDGFASVQFHLESILSTDGIDLLHDLVSDVLAPVRAQH
ncbi:anthranilate synthase family protein [Phytoactinopolyspora halotolerans]|uniref:anthranilate synthase n=1 Tax=Phytoactinopolyspora halotolerans TaxID=1981512 RepID=A0A6L9S865_9ACTN|nr:anthranilate synthase family protein [Phytoactinopolyspora halotolerans]NEE00762.1 chorismate-binding protein [Phytoactinopolyspora halotolerans]